MKAAKTPKKIERNAFSTTKIKKLLQRKENDITSAKANVPISRTFSERLKLTIQTYWMRNKELKMKLEQLQRKISKASF